MAYHTRQRAPLVDHGVQAALMRRIEEIMGLILIAVGLVLLAILIMYSSEESGFVSATDARPATLFGQIGGTVASLLVMTVGYSAVLLPIAALVWGVRFLVHKNQARAIPRIVFLPIAVALFAMNAASYTPPVDWAHSFGLGGLFGDTILGALLNIAPMSPETGLRVLAGIAFLTSIVMFLYVAGFTRQELTEISRFLTSSVNSTGAVVASGAAAQVSRARQARLDRRPPRMPEPEPEPEPELDLARHSITVPQHDQARVDPAPAERISPPLSDRPLVARRTDTVAQVSAVSSYAKNPVHQNAAQTPTARRDPQVAPPVTRPQTRVAPPVHAPKPVENTPVSSADETASSDLLELTSPELPEPELPELQLSQHAQAPEPPDDNRIRERIANAVKNRTIAVPDADMAQPSDPKPAPISRHVTAPAPSAPPRPVRSETADTPRPMPQADRQTISSATHSAADHPHVPPARPAPVSARVPTAPAPARAPVVQPRVVQPRVVQPAAPRPAPGARPAPVAAIDHEDGNDYQLPSLGLLTDPATIERHQLSEEALEDNARLLESVLDDYGVKGEIISVRPGPVVTMYELEPAPGLKASRVIGLADDIARSMSALSARVSTVPGRSVIGIELPNQRREMVVLRELLSDASFGDGKHALPLALGKDIAGEPIIANLAKMPHLLIAGTTGSGKSVAINTMILSLLYKLSPDECRLIMIDPKMLELSVYDGIPHLLSPVVTDPKKAVVALKWVVGEMEDRYRKMSKMGVRNIEGYNGKVADAVSRGEMFSRTFQTGFDDETGDPVFETEEFAPEKMPYIVVVVDEMADLMMVAGKEIEACIQRLAQMARASGIHLIMATQRPSVDVITGTIKANFPTRISFHVTSKIDSRTILGEMGAEQLLGMGDMLYMAGGAKITRVHGPFASDEEVEDIVNHLKAYGPPDYANKVLDGPSDEKQGDIDAVLGLNTGGNTNGEDALYDKAVAIVASDRKCSTSYIQRKLAIGYNKAARLVEQMEEQGIVSEANHVGKREILIPEQD
jgi:S-DNA-T family DNA segregation ATPase FtsK/SpoIIIE